MVEQMQFPSETLARYGVSRRDFLKFCSFMSAVLTLPTKSINEIARALSTSTRPPVIWLEFQDCTGDTESFVRAMSRQDALQSGVTDPSITQILLETVSLDYHETLMAPSGASADLSRMNTFQNFPGQYILVVEGSIPAGENGIYCTIGGRSAVDILTQYTQSAWVTIAAGTCAWEGGLAAANPNPTGAVGVKDAVPGLTNLINIPGCPSNVVNVVATIVYLLTYQTPPPLDGLNRPIFAYGDTVHDNCPLQDSYNLGRFVLQWGDDNHRHAGCFFKMGCRGPITNNNCTVVRWNDGICFPMMAGHGCIGCSEPHFWDNHTPFYIPLELE
jgi:hydrogenase small subunit